MKKKNWITMAAVLALSTSLAVAAPHGDRGGKGGHGRHGAGFEKMAEKLNLTADQKARLESLQQSFREQNKATFETSRETFQQFREAKKANDTAKMEALRPTVEAQRAQMQRIRDAHEQQILAILSAEQRAQFLAMKAEREAHGGKREFKRNRQ
jgi:Spy/CpxP family protein refolding chaperone